jgi:hypothetical protein
MSRTAVLLLTFFASFWDFDHDLITAHIRRYAQREPLVLVEHAPTSHQGDCPPEILAFVERHLPALQ